MKRRFVVIPAYDPDEKLLQVAEKLYMQPQLQVIVVNDGSSKTCSGIFRRVSSFAVVLDHPENMGKGAAIKTALRYIRKCMADMIQHGGDSAVAAREAGIALETGAAREAGIAPEADAAREAGIAPEADAAREAGIALEADAARDGCVVVTADADGQHTPEDILRVLDAAQESRHCLVLGVRRFTGRVPARSMLGNKITCGVFHLLTRTRITDTQTGLRAFDGSLIPMLLDIGGERYEYEMNVLLWCAGNRIPVEEVPIETIYLEENRSSHFRVLRDSAHIYWNILKFLLSSLCCFLIDYSLYGFLGVCAAAAGMQTAAALLLCNTGARLVSAICNFHINRRLVFGHRGNAVKAAVEYAALAFVVLAANTAILMWLVSRAGMNRMAAKLLTECLMFAMSFLAQRFLVFPEDKTAQEIWYVE